MTDTGAAAVLSIEGGVVTAKYSSMSMLLGKTEKPGGTVWSMYSTQIPLPPSPTPVMCARGLSAGIGLSELEGGEMGTLQ